jgi:rod shape-determining protein MreC
VGDAIVTAGLGDLFPPGILVGTVEGLQSESRESFKRAVLKPALRINRVQEVAVLRRQGGSS